MKKVFYECACCKRKFILPYGEKKYKWKLDHEIFCSYNCYSKIFDSKYQAARIDRGLSLGWIRGR